MNKLILLACMLMSSLLAKAQEDAEYEISPEALHDRVNFQLSGLVGVPVGELRDAVKNGFGNVGVGLTTGMVANPFGKKKPSPIFIGGEFSYLTYGVDKVSNVNPPLKTTFNLYYINADARLLLTQEKSFAPFIDGQIGLRILNTRTKIDKNLLHTILNDDQPEVINTTNDTGVNYGLGIGFYKRKPHEGDTSNGSFSLRIMYTWGAPARYVVRDSIYIDPDGFVQYETAQTRTDMIHISFGLMVY